MHDEGLATGTADDASTNVRERVGVVVITRDRSTELRRTLAATGRLAGGLSVVVVDNASTDGTGDMVRAEFPDVRLIRMAVNLGAAARNIGVADLACDYVAFADDDTWWDERSLQRAVDILDAHIDIAVVCGGFVIEPEGRPDPARAAFRESPLPARPGFPGTRVLGFLAGASVVRRTAFLDAGGFNRRFGVGGEEALLAYDLASAGRTIAYVDDIVVHHQPSKVRDPRRRQTIETRNALWTAWLRRPFRDAWRVTRPVVRRSLRATDQRRGLIEALRGLPWVCREREVSAPSVVEDLRRLDHPTFR
jgi:GT2 family glycosyltransferase